MCHPSTASNKARNCSTTGDSLVSVHLAGLCVGSILQEQTPLDLHMGSLLDSGIQSFQLQKDLGYLHAVGLVQYAIVVVQRVSRLMVVVDVA